MIKFTWILFFVFTFCSIYGYDVINSRQVDSLEQRILSAEPAEKMSILHQLFYYESEHNLIKAKKHAYELYRLANEENNTKRRCDALNLKGNFEVRSGTMYNALNYFDSSLVYAREIRDTALILRAFNNMSFCCENLGLYEKANMFHEKAELFFRLYPTNKTKGYIFYNKGLLYLTSNQVEESLSNFNIALQNFISSGDSYGIQLTINSIGNLYFNNGEADRALQAYSSVIDYGLNSDALVSVSKTYANIGEVYIEKGEFKEALKYLNKAKELKEETKVYEARIFNLLGRYYMSKRQYVVASNNFQKALSIAQKKGIVLEIKKAYYNISDYYRQTKNNEQAISYLLKFKSLNDSIQNQLFVKQLHEIQNKYKINEFYEERTRLQQEATQREDKIEVQKIKIARQGAQIKVIVLVMFALIASFGFLIYLYRANKRKSEFLQSQTLEYEIQQKEIENKASELEKLNTELEKISLIARESSNMIVIADAEGEIEWVNKGFVLNTGYTLAEYKENFGTKIIEVSTNRHIKKLINKCVVEKMSVSYSSRIINKKGRTIWLQTTLTPFVGEQNEVLKLIAIDTDITDIKNAERAIKDQKEEIEAHKNEIEDQRDQIQKQGELITTQMEKILESIFYSKKIQNAFLPSSRFMNTILNDFFVLNIQRDIVSGDFYWVNRRLGKTIVSVADCTGHGVPGAFMSMLGITFLNNIINKSGKVKPNIILNLLRDSVIKSLHQTGKSGEASDGMDVFMGVLDSEKMIFQYAAANNPAYLIRDNNLIELKPDKMPIGIHVNDKIPFSYNEIDVKKGDVVYMFSDGFADQFGGHLGKKFKYKRFKQLLLNIHKHSMEDQRELLHESFYEWKGTIEQVDDVLIFGFKI